MLDQTEMTASTGEHSYDIRLAHVNPTVLGSAGKSFGLPPAPVGVALSWTGGTVQPGTFTPLKSKPFPLHLLFSTIARSLRSLLMLDFSCVRIVKWLQVLIDTSPAAASGPLHQSQHHRLHQAPSR